MNISKWAAKCCQQALMGRPGTYLKLIKNVKKNPRFKNTEIYYSCCKKLYRIEVFQL